MNAYKTATAKMLAAARRLGKQIGEGAVDVQSMPGGGRDIQTNAAERAYKALRAYENGDVPTVEAMMPPDWLSGQWAGDLLPAGVMIRCGGNPDRDRDGMVQDELCDAFIVAADEAYVGYQLAHLRAVAEPFIKAEKARVARANKGKQ